MFVINGDRPARNTFVGANDMNWRCDKCGGRGNEVYWRCDKCDSVACDDCAKQAGLSGESRAGEEASGFWMGVLGTLSRAGNGACPSCHSLIIHKLW